MHERLKSVLKEIKIMKSQILEELERLSLPLNITYKINKPTDTFIQKYKELNKTDKIEVEKDTPNLINQHFITDINTNIIKFANTHEKIIEPYIEIVNKYMIDSYKKNQAESNKVKYIGPIFKHSLLQKIHRTFTEDDLLAFNKIVSASGFEIDYNEIAKITGKTKNECILMSFWCLEKIKRNNNSLSPSKLKKISTSNPSNIWGKEVKVGNKKRINTNNNTEIITDFTKTSEIDNKQSAASLIKQWSVDERRIFALYFPHFKRNWVKMADFIPSKESSEISSFYNGYFKYLTKREREFEQIIVNIPNFSTFRKYRRLSLVFINIMEYNELEPSGAFFVCKTLK